MAANAGLREKQSDLQSKQSRKGQGLDSSRGAVCPRQRLTPVREHALSIRLRKHVGKDRRPAQAARDLFYRRISELYPRRGLHA